MDERSCAHLLSPSLCSPFLCGACQGQQGSVHRSLKECLKKPALSADKMMLLSILSPPSQKPGVCYAGRTDRILLSVPSRKPIVGEGTKAGYQSDQALFSFGEKL